MNETLTTIHSLRSVHGKFSTRRISDSDLKTILEASVRAATASARQSYSIIVVDDPDDMRVHLHYVGSKALIFCVDYNRLIVMAEYLGHNFEPNGLFDFITGSTDTVLAAQTAAIAAKSLGIDSLFTNSVHRGDLGKFYEKFNLPSKNCFPLIALILGYSEEPNHIRGRLGGPGVVHFQKYSSPTDKEIQEIIDEYDDLDKNMGLAYRPSPEQRGYMDWFFNVWIKPNQQNPDKHNELYQIMKDSGFLI